MVFSLIWRFFPGPAWLRVIVMLLALGGLVYGLLFFGYPLAAEWIEPTDISTVGE